MTNADREPVFRALEIIANTLVRAQKVDLRFTGLDNIPTRGGAVLVVNHTAYVDFLPAALGLYRVGRRARFMIKSEVMDVAIMRFLVNHTRTIPVDRSQGTDAYRAAVDSLRSGEIVVVYPEATISRSFELKEFKTGAVRMALEAQVPMIPTIVWGAQRQWTKGGKRRMGRAGIPIAVGYGAPIHVPADADVEEQTARLRAQMTEVLHEVQDAYPHPAGEFWVPTRLGGTAPTPEQAAVIEDEEAQRKAAARAAKAAQREGKSRR
ncbi:phospholipid/glycerol acyltransferase [Gordonia polyisoprenivorans VH2]|uniref:Phospholipid/glycerol acyltransferase n=1 Tax=Gordonia polyisoprenivorans (strain DSM 44266 / VH2) TaxID=1112204 RepID=H6MTA3_GORPV|nr:MULTISPECIES: lysophospholipid acyltransferase family protein [Gordonia]AFA71469.1 phospholipid/glycerol acyltransferase [Gordonia polyisoprenivorans VH2]MDF3281409.1 lysophospholipid acyltransferase family protein [Gordonia sp. N1V]OPX17169.1 1-acyl-sn-glycerol-3-phosphate acyltransferase [Gordonia sp. i37]